MARLLRTTTPQPKVGKPTVLTPVVTTLSVNLATGYLVNQRRVQLRRAKSLLSPPATLTPDAVELSEATVRVALVRIRPRATNHSLTPPQVVRVPSVEQRKQTISVSLARIRPRRVVSALPLVIVPAVVAAFVAPPVGTVTFAARDRRSVNVRRFPLQGWSGDSAAGPGAPGRYPNTVLAAGPVSYWRLGEALGAVTAVDLVGGNSGPYGGTLTQGQPGLVTGDPETSVLFGAANANVALPSALLLGQTQWTFECLFRGYNNGASLRVLYEEAGVVNTGDLVSIRISGGVFALNFRDDAGTLNSVPLQSAALGRFDDGGIHHLIVSRNGTAVQGIIDGTHVTNNVIGSGAQTQTPTSVFIGRNTSGPNGAMQEVAIYHRQIGQPEANQHYAAAVAGASGQVVYLQRNLGPKPPRIVADVPLSLETPVVKTAAVARRNTEVRRRAHWLLAGPATLAQPPPVGYAIFVTLTHARPRRIHSSLPLVVVSTTPPVSTVIAVTLAHTRPRRTETRVAPPTTLQVFAGPTVTLAHTRPRPTRKTLAPPVVVRVPQVEQREDTITVALVRTRPRATVHTLGSPQALRVFQAGVPTLARIRPRKTRTLLAPPVVVRVPSVEQVEDTVRVTLARIRPRPTAKRLAAPTVLQTFGGPQVTLVHTRPRPTRRFLAAPTVLQTFSGPAVHLTRIRPRHVVALLGQPQALQTFQGPRVTTVHTRPRPTARFFTEAVVVRVPSVEQLEDTIRVSLVRARPRPMVKTLASPTVLQTFPAGKPTLARIRPRPTTKTLGEPTVLRIPSVEQGEQTIHVQAVRIRPRPTTRYLSPPRVITINPPVVTEITTELVEPRNRRDWPRRFPNQGQRQRLVRETGTTSTYQQRDPFIGPRPPQIIDPLPTQRVETITVALVAVRTRREIPRHTVEHFLRLPTRVIPLPTQQMQTVEAVYLQAVRRRTTDVRRLPHSFLGEPTQVTRTPVVTEITVLGQAIHASLDRLPRRPRSFTVEPTVYAQSGEITVALVRARPRQTISRLTAVSYPQIGRIRVTLVHTRPRPQRALLKPPTVVRVPSVEQVEDTVRVALVRVRPRPTVKSLRPPAALQVFTGPQTHLVRIRPRPQRAVLTPPTRLRTFAGPVEAEITVSLVTARPRRLPHSRLKPPTAVLPYIFPPLLQRLTPGRRPAVHVRLSPPTVLHVEPPVDVHATVILVAAKTRQRYRVGRWTLPEILPPPHAALLPKTTGYAVPGGFSDGDAIATATSDGDARAVSAAEGWVAPVAESDGKAVPDATTDGGVL